MKLLILSLAFLFLMGCGEEPKKNLDDEDDYDSLPNPNIQLSSKLLDYDKLQFIELNSSYAIGERGGSIWNRVHYCLNSAESYPLYDYSDSKFGKVTAYVYADKKRKTLLHKIEGKIDSPNKEEVIGNHGDTIELVFRIPVNKEEYLRIDLKDEEGDKLHTEIYQKPESNTRKTYVGGECYWMNARFR